jgi:hypothetical protein
MKKVNDDKYRTYSFGIQWLTVNCNQLHRALTFSYFY